MRKSIELYLSVNRDAKRWELSHTLVNGTHHKDLGGANDDGRAKPSIDALCLLILLTHISRITNPNRPDHIPAKFHSSLEVLHGSKRKEPLQWQLDVFKASPFDSESSENPDPESDFLRTGKVNNVKHTRILVDVEVEVLTKNELGKPRRVSLSDLEELCLRLAKISPKKAPFLSIQILVKNGRTICSSECEGTLTNTSQFSLLIERNYRTPTCVFWLGGDDEVHRIYPETRLELFCQDQETVGPDKEPRQLLEITAERRLNVPFSKGVETCLVLEKKTAFTKYELDKIESLLEESVSLRPEVLKGHRPQFQLIQIRRPALVRRGIRTVGELKEWHRKVSTLLTGLADRGHVFEIPFR